MVTFRGVDLLLRVLGLANESVVGTEGFSCSLWRLSVAGGTFAERERSFRWSSEDVEGRVCALLWFTVPRGGLCDCLVFVALLEVVAVSDSIRLRFTAAVAFKCL